MEVFKNDNLRSFNEDNWMFLRKKSLPTEIFPSEKNAGEDLPPNVPLPIFCSTFAFTAK